MCCVDKENSTLKQTSHDAYFHPHMHSNPILPYHHHNKTLSLSQCARFVSCLKQSTSRSKGKLQQQKLRQARTNQRTSGPPIDCSISFRLRLFLSSHFCIYTYFTTTRVCSLRFRTQESSVGCKESAFLKRQCPKGEESLTKLLFLSLSLETSYRAFAALGPGSRPSAFLVHLCHITREFRSLPLPTDWWFHENIPIETIFQTKKISIEMKRFKVGL